MPSLLGFDQGVLGRSARSIRYTRGRLCWRRIADRKASLSRCLVRRTARAQKTETTFPLAPIDVPKGDWKTVDRGITAPQGFRAAGISAGLRASGQRPDVSLVVCDGPALAAGVFTQNLLCAAPVTYDKHILDRRSHIRAVLINAGQANAATGPEGYKDTEDCAAAMADALSIEQDDVLVMSTGVIGHRIKKDSLLTHIPHLTSALSTGRSTDIDAATAITTTGVLDLAYKMAALELEIDGALVKLGGMCKGSGMIHPNMATLLGLLTCDAPVEASLWKQMLHQAMDVSFNSITVDGDISTNDTILALSNGTVQMPTISDIDSKAGRLLLEAMIALSQGLAKSVAWDGEGATCLIEVAVSGTATNADAHCIAKSIAGSMLTKAAVFGHDPNWGRIAAAAGYAGVSFSAEDLEIRLGGIALMKQGVPLPFDRNAASLYLKERCAVRETVRIDVGVGSSDGSAMAWGCDLSYDYVRINAEYST